MTIAPNRAALVLGPVERVPFHRCHAVADVPDDERVQVGVGPAHDRLQDVEGGVGGAAMHLDAPPDRRGALLQGGLQPVDGLSSTFFVGIAILPREDLHLLGAEDRRDEPIRVGTTR